MEEEEDVPVLLSFVEVSDEDSVFGYVLQRKSEPLLSYFW